LPTELIIIAVTALLAGLLFMGVMLAGRGSEPSQALSVHSSPVLRRRDDASGTATNADATLRVVWWLTIAIVLLGVGISGSFAAEQAPIFVLGAGAVLGVVIFHEVAGIARRGRIARLAELVAATALIAGLLVLSEYAASPFAILFALVAVAAALAHGPRAGLAAAGLATMAFAIVLGFDPNLTTYGPEDILRLSVGLVATWLLAFVATAYATHQRRAMQGVIDLWRTDPLTGLYNRSQLFVTLEQEVSRTRRSDRGFCVLMIDLDGLKAINDQSGHLRGDEVLRAIGAVIAGSIRNVDSAYRYGGDEFVVLLPETDIVGAFFVAEKIRIGAEEVGSAQGPGEPLTSVSIGLVSHPEDGTGAEQLIAAADRAMYEAKKLGKNQISGNPRPRPPLLARRSIAPASEATAIPVGPEPQPEPTPEPTAEPAQVEAPAAVAVEAARGPEEPVPDVAEAVVPAPQEPAPAMVATATPAPAREPAEPPIVTAGEGTTNGAAAEVAPPEIDDAEPDAQEVRRQIASATRSFDPDHQIRRAMDAFLSPQPDDGDRTRPGH
jgi:diguanylate cyclase (GGDEF)-like protein